MIIIAILVAALLGSLTAGVVALVRAGVAHEESDRSLLRDPPTRAAAVTRRLVGLYVRTLSPLSLSFARPEVPGDGERPRIRAPNT
jgi:hypothetical protein